MKCIFYVSFVWEKVGAKPVSIGTFLTYRSPPLSQLDSTKFQFSPSLLLPQFPNLAPQPNLYVEFGEITLGNWGAKLERNRTFSWQNGTLSQTTDCMHSGTLSKTVYCMKHILVYNVQHFHHPTVLPPSNLENRFQNLELLSPLIPKSDSSTFRLQICWSQLGRVGE